MLGLVLASIGVLAAVYEWVAVRTSQLPTITSMVRATPVPVRALVFTALPAYLWVDHVWLTHWGVP